MQAVGKRQTGFTIVELLIVIVVIGILAAITIVAFNGVTNRAKVASVQADVANAAKQLEVYKSTSSTGTYPPDLATANIKSTSGNTLYYDYNSSTNYYALTAMNSGIVYSSTSTNPTPKTGGAPIMNLVVNPSLETSINGWSSSGSADMTQSRIQVNGKWVYQGVRASTAAAAIKSNSTTPSTVIPGEIYTVSATLTSSVTRSLRFDLRRADNSAIASTNVTLNPGESRRVSVTTAVDTTSVFPAVYWGTGNIGESITMDEAMLNQGPSLYSYADGNTTAQGWSWSATTNESPSSGPAF